MRERGFPGSLVEAYRAGMIAATLNCSDSNLRRRRAAICDTATGPGIVAGGFDVMILPMEGEARDTDVWTFVKPRDAAEAQDRLVSLGTK